MSDYRTIVKDYGSWEEYLTDVRRVPSHAITYSTGASEHESFKWCGARNAGHALEIAERGWAEGSAMIERITLPVVEHLVHTIEQEDIGFDVTGAAFDVGAYLNGVPECWISPTHADAKLCVTIMLNATVSAGVSKEAIMTRGAAVAALALTLQSSGYAVRVYMQGILPTGGYRPDRTTPLVCQRVCLTDDRGGPIDTDRLMFALAHPASARMLEFANAIRLAGKSYGDLIGDVTLHAPDDLGWEQEADFYLHSAYLDDADWQDPKSVERWVKTQYEALRIKKEGQSHAEPT